MSGGIFESLKGFARPMTEALNSYGSIPGRADAIAEQNFPDSARDSSAKNAFRHALGTGMLAQQLGGGPIAAGFAKMAGYGWEAMGIPGAMMEGKPLVTEDMKHDFNANSIGASLAQQTGSQAELVNALRSLATRSIQTGAPGIFERSSGHLTRSVR